MAILKLVGAKRFMHKKASPNVIELNGLTDDIKDNALVQLLLGKQRIDADNKAHPVFILMDEAKPTQESKAVEADKPEPVESKPVAKKKAATKKKATRSRKRAKPASEATNNSAVDEPAQT